MTKDNLSKVFTIVLAGLFLVGGLEVFALSPEGSASARASDSEPNDNSGQAVTLTSGEVVEGSLLISSQWDTEDYYKMDVPFGKALNASLYLVEYNDSNIGQYNLQLYLYGPPSGQGFTTLDTSNSRNRWETVASIQYWNLTSPRTMYIHVEVNYSGWPNPQVRTSPTHYTVSASLSDVPDFTTNGPEAQGYLDGGTGPVGRAFYRLNPGPADYQAMRARLTCPATGVFGVYAYQLWNINNGWYLQNASWVNTPGYIQNIVFNGCGGTYYIKVAGLSGNGTYSLTVNNEGRSRDENNIPDKAELVRDLYPRSNFIDQGLNWVDWYKINALSGRPITEAYFMFVAGSFQEGSSLSLVVYDKDFNQLNSASVPRWVGNNHYDYAWIQNTTVGYTGPVYFVVRANSFYGNMPSNFIPSNGWYKLSFTLLNDPPIYKGGLPEIHIPEDGIDSSLVLSNYFSDPENDTLNFTLVGSNLKTHPVVNATTGLVRFTPTANWSGSEVVRFRAIDDGPGNKWVEANTTVVVDPVNDPPKVLGRIDDLILVEEQQGQTPTVATLFLDIDDTAVNLTYSIRVLGQDTHPEGANLTMYYDATSGAFKLGPVRSAFGSFRLEVSCTDRHPGTVPATIEFNLSVWHKNHAPALVSGTPDPLVMTIPERGSNSSLNIQALFTDPDTAPDYANDSLNFTVTGMKDLLVSLLPDGTLSVDTGTVQYYPGRLYEEKLVINCRDRASLKASLNITVNVIPVDDPPFIASNIPELPEVTVNEGKKETFRVTTSDNDTGELTFAWYLDGVKDKGQTGAVFTFYPDFKMGGTAHTLKVVASDGTTEASYEWIINVLDVNRLPTLTITSPVNFTRFKKGTFVSFTAEARDEDFDNLTLTWRDGAGTVLGTGPSISTDKLDKGSQTVRLEVSDGKGSIYQDVVVSIYSPAPPPSSKGFIPAYTAVLAFLAAGLALALAASRRGRRERL